MHPGAWEPLARALEDFLAGRRDARALAHAEGSEPMVYPAELFFRSPDRFPEVERHAVEACRGRVLDLGAGAGCHALVLQERGHTVVALDLHPRMVEVMRSRGVRDPRAGEFHRLTGETFDTVLLLMHGIGFVGTLPGLHRFLLEIRPYVAPGGQILLDSLDVLDVTEPSHGAYPGEILYRFEYDGWFGDAFRWLYVDPHTLRSMARETGWRTRILYRQTTGDHRGRYLARLTRSRVAERFDNPSGRAYKSRN